MALVVPTIVPGELDQGRHRVLGHKEGAARQHALRDVDLGPIHELQVGRLLRVVDEAHHVALLLEVEVQHVVASLALEPEQLVVEGDHVCLVLEALVLDLRQRPAAHLDHHLALGDGRGAAHAPAARRRGATRVDDARVEGLQLRVGHVDPQLLVRPVVHGAAAAVGLQAEVAQRVDVLVAEDGGRLGRRHRAGRVGAPHTLHRLLHHGGVSAREQARHRHGVGEAVAAAA